MKTDLKLALSLSTAICLLPGAAFAQASTAPAAAADAADNGGVADIIVTATRRATSSQKVMATIDVASSDKLLALNVKEASGIEAIVPGVTVARSGGVTPFIRGIGTFNAGFSEASVGVYIDGVYLPNSSGVLFSFNNIERVEVLKGPQGTLYGRNTTGGLINVITRAPGDKPTLDASVGYGNYDTFTQSVYGSTPITDTVSANLAVYHSKQAKGWSTNITTGDDVQKSEETGVYGKVQWKPGPDTKVTLSGLYNRSASDKGWAFAILPGTYGLDGTPYLGKYRIANRADPSAVYRGDMTSLRIDQSLGFADFFSLTAYQYGRQVSHLAQNGIPGNAVNGQSAQNVFIDFNSKTFSQEFQLNSKSADSKLDWLVGAYYYHDDTDVATALTPTCIGAVCAPLPGNLPPQLVDTQPTTRSISGYADATYSIFEGTRITGGIRYTHEKKGINGLVTAYQGLPDSVAVLPASIKTTPTAAGVVPSITASRVTFRAVLAQDLSRDVHAYASFNRSFKSGNYNPNVVNQPPVRPESLDSYEVGIKSDLFDRTLRLNLSGFYYNYTDIQVRSNAGLPAGSASIAQNVAAAHSKGIDAQFELRPVKGLSLSGGAEYLDAKYADYPGTACTTPRQPGGGFLGGIISVACNLAGFPLPISPKYSGNLTVSYAMETRYGTVTLVANDSYKSRYTYASDNSVQQSPTNIIDGSLSWKSIGGRYDAQLFVRNLTNIYRYSAGQAGSTYVYVPGEPRTYGFTLGYHI